MGKSRVHVVLLGHPGSGKSTTAGQILNQKGLVDPAHLQQLEEQATELNHRSSKYAWVFDKLGAERELGRTVDISLDQFTGATHAFTLVDTPGSPKYTKNLVSGITQGDAALLILDASPGSFELGVSKEGHTREQVVLASSLGVKQMVVAVNKMDATAPEPYSKARFDDVVKEATAFLSKRGFPAAKLKFVPVSAQEGENLTARSQVMDWYREGPLVELLDALEAPKPAPDKPLRMPVHQTLPKAKGGAKVFVGKVESGNLKVGAQVVLSPMQVQGEVKSIKLHGEDVKEANAGLSVGVSIKLNGGDDVEWGRGVVVSEAKTEPAKGAGDFVAQMMVVNHPGEIRPGYAAVLDCHTSHTPVRVLELLSRIDRKTGQEVEKEPNCLKTGDAALVRLVPLKPLCIEPYAQFPGLGRFVIRDAGRTVAMGSIKSVTRRGEQSEKGAAKAGGDKGAGKSGAAAGAKKSAK